MKSTIKVELGHNNQPVIRMRVNSSDDVRDVLFQQFKEAFGGESNLCSVTFNSAFLSSDGTTCIMEISPVSPATSGNYNYGTKWEHITTLRTIDYMLREQKHMGWVSLCVGGDIVYWEDNQERVSKFSPEFQRCDLERLHISDLIKKVNEILDSRETWKPLPEPTHNKQFTVPTTSTI